MGLLLFIFFLYPHYEDETCLVLGMTLLRTILHLAVHLKKYNSWISGVEAQVIRRARGIPLMSELHAVCHKVHTVRLARNGCHDKTRGKAGMSHEPPAAGEK